MSLKITRVITGEIEENCWIMTDEVGHTIIIDPGDAAVEILKQVKNLKIKWILLTHTHWDHTLGLAKIVAETGAKIAVHSLEAGVIERGETNPPTRPVELTPLPVGKKLVDGDLITFSEYELKVIHTPGHTHGSVCYLFQYHSKETEDNPKTCHPPIQSEADSEEDEACLEGQHLFTGDTLFRANHGRTDLPTGDRKAMKQSLAKLFKLPSDTIIHSGHGDNWTIGEAQKFGFLNQ